MMDIKKRQAWLKETSSMLSKACDDFDDQAQKIELIDIEFDKWIRDAGKYSQEYEIRAGVYDDPLIANAKSDEEITERAEQCDKYIAEMRERIFDMLKQGYEHPENTLEIRAADAQRREYKMILNLLGD